jgi:hypothetical protein
LPVPPPGNGGGGGGGSGSGLDPSVDRNVENYRSVQSSNEAPGVPTLRSTGGEGPHFSFRSMRVSGGGFGGVVFGAPLSISSIPKPVRLNWVTDSGINGTSDWGHFDVILKGGTVAMSRRLRADEVYAASKF